VALFFYGTSIVGGVVMPMCECPCTCICRAFSVMMLGRVTLSPISSSSKQLDARGLWWPCEERCVCVCVALEKLNLATIQAACRPPTSAPGWRHHRQAAKKSNLKAPSQSSLPGRFAASTDHSCNTQTYTHSNMPGPHFVC